MHLLDAHEVVRILAKEELGIGLGHHMVAAPVVDSPVEEVGRMVLDVGRTDPDMIDWEADHTALEAVDIGPDADRTDLEGVGLEVGHNVLAEGDSPVEVVDTLAAAVVVEIDRIHLGAVEDLDYSQVVAYLLYIS